MTPKSISTSPASEIPHESAAWHALTSAEVVEKLAADPESGLSAAEAVQGARR